jgi:hypothetical protein
MPEQFYDAEFPDLRKEGWTRTSEPDSYNCIAFAVGDTARYWWPNPFFPDPCDDYWPPGVPNEETVDAFSQMFVSVGFVKCDAAGLEEGFEKVALYALRGTPTHAAVLHQTASGEASSDRTKISRRRSRDS